MWTPILADHSTIFRHIEMSGQIFISYRREDASYPAGRLYDRLSAHFPQNQVFIDVDNLDPGVDFVEAIEQSVGSCDVLIAVIGRHWLVSSDKKDRRRLDNPADFVRIEIATALRRDIRVIPVLVEGAPVPEVDQLPDDLKALVRRNAVEVSHSRFNADFGRLVKAIERVLENADAERKRREKELLEVEQREKDRLETEQQEKECLEAQQREKERLEVERRRKEKQERLEVERRQREEQEQLEAARLEKERLEVEQRERQRSDAERREKERREAEQREKERLEVERPERERVAAKRTAPVDWIEQVERCVNAKDYAKALLLSEKAADAGSADAMYNLGILYDNGLGVAQDYGKAREWYQKAVDAANTNAMYNLGWLYQEGLGGTQDYCKMRECYQKAARAGDAEADQALSLLHLELRYRRFFGPSFPGESSSGTRGF